MSLKKRFKEPSSYSGLAAILAGAGLFFGAGDAVAPIAQSIVSGGEAIASGNVALGITAIIGGVLGVVLPESKSETK
jgi:branched-subunit amino acid permease